MHFRKPNKHLCQQVGCARTRLLSHTVQQKLRLFLVTQVYAWMEFLFLIFGIWVSANRANKIRDLADLQGNLFQSTTLNMRSQISTKHINLDLITVNHVSLNVKSSGSSAM